MKILGSGSKPEIEKWTMHQFGVKSMHPKISSKFTVIKIRVVQSHTILFLKSMSESAGSDIERHLIFRLDYGNSYLKSLEDDFIV